jgi:hypothetical protein
MLPVRPPTPPSVRLDLTAFALLAVGLLVAVCLFSADPPDASGAWPDDLTATANLLGPGGAWVSRSLLESLGVSVYVMLAAWFVLVVLLFLRNTWLTWTRRLLGWVLLVPCAAVIADWIGPGVLGGPLTGSGGTLGAWLAHWLTEQLAPWPRGIAVGTAVAVGLALALDRLIFAIVRGTGWTGHAFGLGIRRLAHAVARRASRRQPDVSWIARNPRHVGLAPRRSPFYNRFFAFGSPPGSCRSRFAISIAVTAASKPLLPALPPARLTACSNVSQVNTPKITGRPVTTEACRTPFVAAAATWS